MNKNNITYVIIICFSSNSLRIETIDKKINDIRLEFPDNEIILQINGLKQKELNFKENYDEYKNKILWKCIHSWKNVLPIIYEKYIDKEIIIKQTKKISNTLDLLFLDVND